MDNTVLQAIRERRSYRKYKADQISQEELDTILEAGTWAATAKGLQSPVMVAIQDAETIAQISRMNAAVMGTTSDPMYGAPTMIIVFGDPTVTAGCYIQDASLVMGNLMLAAHSIGVQSCWINRAMEEFQTEEGKALLRKWGLPETLVGVGHCILGYADCDAPTPKARKEGYIVKI